MASIVTLTLNPAIDAASETATVRHTAKLRTSGERLDPAGGGINVARVLTRLGIDAEALYFAGGLTGPVLTALLDQTGIRHRPLAIAGDTRISLSVHELGSGLEYRFVPRGPEIAPQEWQACLDTIGRLECDWLVLSGSLPRGAPDDLYARLIAIARTRQMAVVLDTSGAALRAALAGGGIRLVKPSLSELEQLSGQPLSDEAAIITAARAIVERGGAELVAVSRGGQGAVLVGDGPALVQPAIHVEAKSAVGAGDSFVAAMTFALARGWPPAHALGLGIAAGAAAALTPGTDLCHRADVERLAATLGITGLG